MLLLRVLRALRGESSRSEVRRLAPEELPVAELADECTVADLHLAANGYDAKSAIV